MTISQRMANLAHRLQRRPNARIWIISPQEVERELDLAVRADRAQTLLVLDSLALDAHHSWQRLAFKHVAGVMRRHYQSAPVDANQDGWPSGG
jgi:hypothetical protein